MRTFPHRPDLVHMAKVTDFVFSGVGRIARRIERTGPSVWGTLGPIAVARGWEAIELGWAQERPLEELRRILATTASWVRGDFGGVRSGILLRAAPGWLITLTVAGDRPTADELARRIPLGVLLDLPANRPNLDRLTALARLVDGGDITPALQAVAGWVDHPATDVEAAAQLAAELPVIEAVASHDDGRLPSAFAGLIGAHVERYGATASTRRNLAGLICWPGLMLAALAAARGLPVPPDDPYLPLGLIAEM